MCVCVCVCLRMGVVVVYDDLYFIFSSEYYEETGYFELVVVGVRIKSEKKRIKITQYRCRKFESFFRSE